MQTAYNSLLEYFTDHYQPEPNSGCWLWLGALWDGYGRVHYKGKTTRAHRIAYELYKGPIPKNLVLDHLCRTRCCVNPNHLEAVTSKVNSLRGTNPFAINANKTHCSRNHKFTAETVYLWNNQRLCKLCDILRHKEWRAKKRSPSP